MSSPPASEVTKESIAALTAPMQSLHDDGANCTYEWRFRQLQTLRRMLVSHWDEWAAALKKDLGKCRVEAVAMELLMVRTEIDFALQHLQKWMRARSIPSPGFCLPAFSRLEPRPLNGPAVLIIGPSNYPVCLVLHPAVGALAAGNPVVCKPSELTSTVEALFAKLIAQYFANDTVVCVTGGVSETTALLQQSWGRIFFTGSENVGKIVAKAAAETLTPVTLELGGKAPCYVDGETCPFDMDQVANRILWSKLVNAGQTCAATDILIIDESMVTKFITSLKKGLRAQFGDDPSTSDLGRIVSVRHAERLVELIRQVEQADHKTTKILTGGSQDCDVASRYVAPTIILNPPPDSKIMHEEIFGPILPIVTVKNRWEAIDFMKKMPGVPLCLYIFTTSEKVFREINQRVPAGSVMRNDCLVHLSSPFIPFGGLGSSGYGSYHGKFSFDLFSHTQPIMYRPSFPGFDLGRVRFHPFGKLKGYIITDIAVVLPPIPVLHIRVVLRTLVIAVAASLLWKVLPVQLKRDYVRIAVEPIVLFLENAASMLRQSCSS